MLLVDSNILFDMWDRDPVWWEWSASQMRRCSLLHEFYINSIIYAEVSVRFTSASKVDEQLLNLGISLLPIRREEAFLAGQAFVRYRRQGGNKSNVLPDFFIGAQAVVRNCGILTRDVTRYRSYFPEVSLIAPQSPS